MYTTLEVQNLKGLRYAKLRDLGRINVICGKNNSGKSTLLEGISSYDTIRFGRKLDAECLEVLRLQSLGDIPFRNRQIGESVYANSLQVVAGAKSPWFSDEAADFQAMIHTILQNERVLRPAEPFAPHALASAYRMAFMHDRATILIPAKRQLVTAADVISGEQVVPTGAGLINYLFYAKNQLQETEDSLTYGRIAEAFTRISSGYSFHINVGQANDLRILFAREDGRWIPARDSGLGLHDLMIVLYFAIHPSYQIVLIEEPENHLHPEMQRKLLSFLRNGTDKQYFLSTHSNVFLNNALVDRVFFTTFTDQVTIDDATSRASILDDLGYSVADNLVSDLVILVEGPTDVPVIEEFLVKMGVYGTYDIKIWPLGGDIMDQLDLSVFAEKYAITALVDNDPKSSKVRNRFVKNCKDSGIKVHRLKGYALENYFSLRALRDVFGVQIPATVTQLKSDAKLQDQIKINVKHNNRKIAQAMELAEIEGTDLHKFLQSVERICREKG